MRSQSRWLAALLGLLWLGAVLTGCQSKADFSLKLSPKEGATFAVHSVVSQNMSQELMGQPMNISQNLVFDYEWKVTQVDSEGNVHLQVTYDHIAIEQTQNGQKVSYDSASDEPPPKFFTGVEAMIGKSFVMVLTPSGRLKEVQGLDALFQEVTEASGLDDVQKQAFHQALVETFGEDAVGEQIDALFGQYPSQPLSVGSTWEADAEHKALFPLKVHTTYTVEAREGQTVSIALKSVLQSDPEQQVDEGSRIFKLSYDLSGDQQGTMKVDLTQGMPIESHITQHLKGQLTVVNVDTGETLPVPMSMDSDIAITVTEK